MAKNPTLNRIHQKSWYARTRQDPMRWRAFLDKRRAYKQARRNAEQTVLFRKAKPKAIRCGNTQEESDQPTLTWASIYDAVVAGVAKQVPTAP